MNFFVAIFIWLLMGAILVTGVALAVKGTFWLLIVGFVLFVLSIAKIGCLTH